MMVYQPPLNMSKTGFQRIQISTGNGFAGRNVFIEQPRLSKTLKVSDQGFGNPPRNGLVDANKGAAFFSAAKAFAAARPASNEFTPADPIGDSFITLKLTYDGQDMEYSSPFSRAPAVVSDLVKATMLLANESKWPISDI